MKKYISIILAAVFALLLLSSCASHTSAVTYKRHSMSEAEYSYWFSTLKAQVLSTYNNGLSDDGFWDKETPEGVKYSEFFTERINEQIKSIIIASALFDENDLELDDNAEELIEADIEEKIEFAGGKANLESDLAEYGMTIPDLKKVYLTQAKISAYHNFFSSGSLDPEDVETYYNESYRAMKMIQIYTGISFVTDVDGNYVYDDTGAIKTITLDSFQKQKKQELAETAAEAIRRGEDIDKCVSEFSETDFSDHPNGFLVCKNDETKYGADVINALFSMEEGEVRTVEDSVMTFIIYRDKLPKLSSLSRSDLEMLSGLTDNMIDEKIDRLFADLSENAVLNQEVTDKYDIRTVRKNSYY